MYCVCKKSERPHASPVDSRPVIFEIHLEIIGRLLDVRFCVALKYSNKANAVKIEFKERNTNVETNARISITGSSTGFKSAYIYSMWIWKKIYRPNQMKSQLQTFVQLSLQVENLLETQ